MNTRSVGLLTCAALALCGCASPSSNVLFVTKTSLGIDLDGAPPTASIAYDRVEGYVGPRFENGALPPVVAKISSDGGILGRNVRQYYATGTAANKLAGSDAIAAETELKGDGKAMFFGTGTTLGIKIGFTTTVPDSFVFGYRRKEVSLIPIGTGENGQDGKPKRHYPSVIGVFGTDFEGKTVTNTEFGLAQFFATGTAAEALAANEQLQTQFQSFAQDAIGLFKEAVRVQQATVLGLVDCFSNVADGKVDLVLDNANALRLFDSATYNAMKKTAATDKQKARGQYVSAITVINVDPPDRSGRVEGHRVYVCGLVS